MSKEIVKSSDLIKTLKNAKIFGTAKALLPYLEKQRTDYENSKDKKILSVEIDTDDDFNVNGSSILSGNIVVEENETLYQALVRYFSELKFECYPTNQYKVDNFKEMVLNNKENESELNIDGFLSIGGNQTLHVCLVATNSQISLGGIKIDLAL